MEVQIQQLRVALDQEKKKTDDLQKMVGKDKHIEESTLINAIRKGQMKKKISEKIFKHTNRWKF